MISEKTLRTLEYEKVLERLASYAGFSLSKEFVLALRPETAFEAVRESLLQVSETMRALESRIDLSMGGAHDIRPQISRAALGGALDAPQLLDIQSTLECAERIRMALMRFEVVEYPFLATQRANIHSFREIISLIAQTVNAQGEILDSASPALAKIRADLRIAHHRLLDRLQSILSSQTYKTAIQEPIITIRNGRYVLPVRADAKGVLRGIVHDQSSSGATLYIEPLQTTELNNRWRELQLQEQDEIARILHYIAERIALQAPALQAAVLALATLDLALAKARFGTSVHATIPHLVTTGQLVFEAARHPLLIGNVVPIDVRLGQDFRILLITGPNTGGKTVALKTVGLLTLMAQSGIPIPVAPGSQAAVFDGIFADIGDEQGIEQSLSTFSSHLTNIIRILHDLTPNSLLLLDELGAGTDPAEGSALARSLLLSLLERNVRVMATTHYSELKAFAANTDGVENANVEFDVETLSPTYRLSIGLPGRSNALAIARRLGLPQEIVEGSQAFITAEEKHVETMLAEIQSQRELVSELYASASAAQRQGQALRSTLEQEIQLILREREAILRTARAEAQTSVDDLRRELDRAEAELRLNGGVPQVALAGLRQRLDLSTQRQTALFAVPEAAATRAPSVAAPLASKERPLGVGDRVAILRSGQEGVIVAVLAGRNELEVQIGPFKTRIKAAEVQLISAYEREPQPTGSGVHFARSDKPAPSVEFDLRGWRVDAVLHELERYLNDAYMANLPFVRIIHGKGTGALRQVVREELATNPLVSGFHPADAREGGEGVTIATLAV